MATANYSLITSQIDTAPKRELSQVEHGERLITSLIDTAPKQNANANAEPERLITSQIDTAPKPCLHFFLPFWV